MFKKYYKILNNIKYITKYKLFNTRALFSLLSYFYRSKNPTNLLW